jgi:ATP-dependent Lhr-like helicase
LHASSSIIFNVLEQHDPHNLLLRQAYNEVFFQQIDEPRLLQVFERISKSKVIYKETNNFTPLSFPIKVDSIRQSLSNEALLARIEKIRKPNKRKKAKKI